MMEFRPSMKRKAAGWSLMGLGVIGLVLPFLNGLLFLALGMFVMRHQYLWAHRGLGWVAGRWPDAVTKAEGMEARMVAWTRARAARLRGMLGRG
jgi:hypothetical protein